MNETPTNVITTTPSHPTQSNYIKSSLEPEGTPDLDYPPFYTDLRKWQQELPQHNLSLPYPEGENGRYVKFTCGIKMLGWNNVLNEMCVAFFLLC